MVLSEIRSLTRGPAASLGPNSCKMVSSVSRGPHSHHSQCGSLMKLSQPMEGSILS